LSFDLFIFTCDPAMDLILYHSFNTKGGVAVVQMSEVHILDIIFRCQVGGRKFSLTFLWLSAGPQGRNKGKPVFFHVTKAYRE